MNQPATTEPTVADRLALTHAILSEYEQILAWSVHADTIGVRPAVTVRPGSIASAQRRESMTEIGMYLAEAMESDSKAEIKMGELRCIVMIVQGESNRVLIALTFSVDGDIGKSVMRTFRRVGRAWKRPEPGARPQPVHPPTPRL